MQVHPPAVCAGIRSTSGRYASHWNAFLFSLLVGQLSVENTSLLALAIKKNTSSHEEHLIFYFSKEKRFLICLGERDSAFKYHKPNSNFNNNC